MQLEDPQCFCRERNQERPVRAAGESGLGGGDGHWRALTYVFTSSQIAAKRLEQRGKHPDIGFSEVLPAGMGTVGFCGVAG